MKPLNEIWNSNFSLAKPRETNRLFAVLSINMDDRERVFETAVKILEREKENSKQTLEELWQLKKNSPSQYLEIIDLLIEHYQEKVDTVRKKEEHLKKLSKESQNLLQEQRQKGQERDNINQQLKDISKELEMLQSNYKILDQKEKQLAEESEKIHSLLNKNALEIMGGLSECILIKTEAVEPKASSAQTSAEAVTVAPKGAPLSGATQLQAAECVAMPESMPQTTVKLEDLETKKTSETDTIKTIYKAFDKPEKIQFPKSIVKTEKGRVLGEYYYDPKVHKNLRHYIFNGGYFIDQLAKGMAIIETDSSRTEPVLFDLLLMAIDIQNRVKSNNIIHFEISTNEILNLNTVTELIQNIKTRNFLNIKSLASRFKAKVEIMGKNYEFILAEQMKSLYHKEL